MAVPLWLIIGLGGVLLLGLGFLGGWAVGSNDSSSSSANDLGQFRIAPNSRIPGGGSNGGGSNGGGGGFTVPQPRTQNGNGVVLGVVTEPSSGDGARIVAVVPSSPAEAGGLQRGDVITKVGDDDVKNPAQLATRVRAHKSGDRVTVTYTRDGDTKTTTVRLANRTTIVPQFPSSPNSGGPNSGGSELRQRQPAVLSPAGVCGLPVSFVSANFDRNADRLRLWGESRSRSTMTSTGENQPSPESLLATCERTVNEPRPPREHGLNRPAAVGIALRAAEWPEFRRFTGCA